MANKTELIRQKMAQTRESLRMKLDSLEDRTLGVVKQTTDTVAHVAEQVTDTVESARKAVNKTVRKSVRALDLTRHVEEYPWAAMGGAVATGFVASWLVSRAAQSRGRSYDYPGQEPYAAGTYPAAQAAGFQRADDTLEERSEQRSAIPNWLNNLAQTFAPQLEDLKHLAVGAAVATARDMALRSVPGNWTGELGKLFDGLTEKLGGTPLPEEEGSNFASSTAAGETRPRWEETRGTEPRAEPQKPAKKRPQGNGRHSEAAR